MKLTIETLNRAYTEKKIQENRSKWFSRVIDVLAMINNIIAKIIPFPTFFTHQNHYKLKVINDGFSDLEDLWKYGYKNQTYKHIKDVIDGMKEFKSLMTPEQLERFEQLNKFSNIFPKDQSKEEASPGNKAENTLFTSSLHSITPTEQTAAGSGNSNSNEADESNNTPVEELKPIYMIVPPWYLFPEYNGIEVPNRNEIPLDDLLNWYFITRKDERHDAKEYSSKKIERRIKKFNRLFDISPKIYNALDLFVDIMKKRPPGQTYADETLEAKINSIKTESPELYAFFFEPYNEKRDLFISHPLLFRAFEVAREEDGRNDANNGHQCFIADLVITLSFLDYLLPLNGTKPNDIYDPEVFLDSLNLDQPVKQLMGLLFYQIKDFKRCTKMCLRDDNGLSSLNTCTLLAKKEQHIKNKLSEAYNTYWESIPTISETYEKIRNFQYLYGNDAYFPFDPDDRVEELGNVSYDIDPSDRGRPTTPKNKLERKVGSLSPIRPTSDNKENTQQFNGEPTPPNATRNGLFDGDIKLSDKDRKTAFATPGHPRY